MEDIVAPVADSRPTVFTACMRAASFSTSPTGTPAIHDEVPQEPMIDRLLACLSDSDSESEGSEPVGQEAVELDPPPPIFSSLLDAMFEYDDTQPTPEQQ